MANPVRHRLEQIHAKMKVLKDKTTSGVNLTDSEQAELDQLIAARDEVIVSLLLPVYYRSPLLA